MLMYSHGNTPILLSTPSLRCAAAAWLLTVAASMSSQQMPPAAATNTTQSIPKYEIVVFKDVMVPRRDGVKLACNIYRPALNGQLVGGKPPVSLRRTPYGRDAEDYGTTVFVPLGYVAVRQAARGGFNSEGTWRFLRDDSDDGYDTDKWIGQQPWADGGI